MITQIAQTATIGNVVNLEDEQQLPMPIRVIRKISGLHKFVELQSEAELTDAERRERYCRMFNIYG